MNTQKVISEEVIMIVASLRINVPKGLCLKYTNVGEEYY